MASIEYTRIKLPKDETYIRNVLIPILSDTSIFGFTYDLLDDFDRIKKNKTRIRCIYEFIAFAFLLLIGFTIVYLLINWNPIAAFFGFVFFLQLFAWLISYIYCYIKVLFFTIKINRKYSAEAPILKIPDFLKDNLYSIQFKAKDTVKLSKEEKLDFYYRLYKDGGLNQKEYEEIKTKILSS